MSQSLKVVIVVFAPLIVLGFFILAANFYLKTFPKPCPGAVFFKPCLNGVLEYLSILIGGVFITLVTFVLLIFKIKVKK